VGILPSIIDSAAVQKGAFRRIDSFY